jgi:choline-sulfatase
MANVLYMFADQLGISALRKFGGAHGANTPNIDYLADRGVRFTHSYCSTPQCSPSRSSIFTGLYPHKTKVVGNTGMPGVEDLSPDLPSIGRQFQEQGYTTAYFGKWHLGKAPLEQYGFEFTHNNDKEKGKAKTVAERDAMTTDRMLNFLDSQAAGSTKPWLAVVSWVNPHDIYSIRGRIAEDRPLDTQSVELPVNFIDTLADKPAVQAEFRYEDQGKPLTTFTEDQWKGYIAFYRELVEEIDLQVGRILDKLRAVGHLDDTLIVFTADHGDMLAGHRTPFKGPMMYDELVRIPIIYSWPGHLPEGETRDQLTLNTDHFPTICELMGMNPPQGIDGVSMKPAIFQSEAPSREAIILQYFSKQQWINPIRTIVERDTKYNLYVSGEEELYDMAHDAGESVNLAGQPEWAAKQDRLKQELLQWMNREHDPFFTYSRTDRTGQPI